MDKPRYDLLDNPVWNALQTAHQAYAKGTPVIQRYPGQMLPFLGCKNPAAANLQEIEPWMLVEEKLFMVGEIAPLPPNWAVAAQLECVQMICPEQNLVRQQGISVIQLTAAENEELTGLIQMVQPGYFFKDTALSGRYFGIRVENKLVAVAGERMRMPGFTEISAVCTHPSFSGKGFAQILVSHLVMQNYKEGTLPFLHVLRSNTRAINVYHLLGFRERRIIPFWQLVLNAH